ncbi:MAG: type IV toxin-antitoxin system AbiEi family antitoxin domain-containing protein [Solirubrobacterales bacterium]
MARLAERQHGVVARWQLLERGMSARMIEERLRLGRLHRLHRGVYAVGHRMVRWEGRLMSAVLACGRDAVLSHRSAAQLWGLIPRRAIPPEATRPLALRPQHGIRPRQAELRADEVGEVDGIPVASVARTMLDLASLLDQRDLENAWNEMEVRQLWDPVGVGEMVGRHPGKRGVARLRRLMHSRGPSGRTRSELESRFLRLLDDHHLPRPRLNSHLHLRGRFFEIDALWPHQRLAVELDGAAVHRTHRAFQRDRERDRILVAEGYRTARVTWEQLHGEPGRIAADLRSTLAHGPRPHPHGR